MSPQDFAYWLQGFLEVSEAKTMDGRQVQILRDHLALVMSKRTPERSTPDPFPTQRLPGSGAGLGQYLYPPYTIC